MKTEFLKLIRNAMQVVVDLDKKLEMETFFVDNTLISSEGKTTIHNCNTAACVAGYASLDSKVLSYIGVEDFDKETVESEIPNDVWWELSNETCSKLADSLFASSAEERADSFTEFHIDCGVDPFEPLPKHLTTENPSAKDALDYIDYLIETVDKLPS